MDAQTKTLCKKYRTAGNNGGKLLPHFPLQFISSIPAYSLHCITREMDNEKQNL